MSRLVRRSVAGLTIEHRDDGLDHSDRPLVVMVPGAMDRATGFRRTARHLGDVEVVAYDRRGYAGSVGLPPSDELVRHAEDLAVVCRHVTDDHPRPILVVGHSQGGLIALTAAAHDLVRGLVGLVVWEPPTPWFDWYDGSVSLLDLGDDAPAAAERFMRHAIGDRLWERLPAATRAERLADGPALLADLRSSRRPEAAPALDRVAVPVVVGRGSLSSEHHRRAAEVVATSVPHGRLVEVQGANHGVHLSHPAAFAAVVAGALDALGAVDTARPPGEPAAGPAPRTSGPTT